MLRQPASPLPLGFSPSASARPSRDVQYRTVLPFGCRGEARQAFEGDLSEQVGPIEKEAGVGKQL